MLAETATAALLVTLVVAAAARIAGAVSTSGAVAGCAVGGALGIAFGLPGLAPLGAFFVLGSLATRFGYARKAAKGAAERGGGARGAGRVLAKGGVAALAALWMLAWPVPCAAAAACGALAAALADTLGTEIGALSDREPRLLPTLRRVPAGTPGAVSGVGTIAAGGGAVLLATAAAAAGLVATRYVGAIAWSGFAGAMLESVLGGCIPAFARMPGTLRNVVTTAVGATLACLAAAGGLT